jgi:hypothetical protein
MMTKDLDHQPTWNTSLRLPLVTDDSELFELQILLGGITLVLSRLHPAIANNRFTYTRGLGMKIARVLERPDVHRHGLTIQTKFSSAHLEQALAECDRALDPASLVTFRKLLVQTVQMEHASAPKFEHSNFTCSAFFAHELESTTYPAESGSPHRPGRPNVN